MTASALQKPPAMSIVRDAPEKTENIVASRPPLRASHKLGLFAYDVAWFAATPFLWLLNKRLRSGFKERLTLGKAPKPADVWMQAASAGEAYVAETVVREMKDSGLKTLVTSCTDQGLDILRAVEKEDAHVSTARFPFDAPTLMKRFLKQVRPKVVVLVETEIWPGLLAMCRQAGIEVVIVNGRLRERSLSGYLTLASFFTAVGPCKVLAADDASAARFGFLFGERAVQRMSNAKFDRVDVDAEVAFTAGPLAGVLKPGTPFVVLGSIRKEEEAEALQIVLELHKAKPMTVIGLFPRHMERVDAWKKLLEDADLPFVVRSEQAKPAPRGHVVLWDVFGELAAAYSFSRAAFIGGSLKPLGGQNFLEPLACGVTPVVGPHRRNFQWIGEKLFEQSLAVEVADAKEAVEKLVKISSRPKQRPKVKAAFADFIAKRRGGAAQAAALVIKAAKRKS